jgi:hypothetical protein
MESTISVERSALARALLMDVKTDAKTPQIECCSTLSIHLLMRAFPKIVIKMPLYQQGDLITQNASSIEIHVVMAADGKPRFAVSKWFEVEC